MAKAKIKNNIAQNYGGGIFALDVESKCTLSNIEITENSANSGSGGGIYTYGILDVSGNDTNISNNVAGTYGGGIMLKTEGTIENTIISQNKALTEAGGGIRCDGRLILKNCKVIENKAFTTGGGVDWSSAGGILICDGENIIEHNEVNENESNICPNFSNEADNWYKDEKLNITPIDIKLEKRFILNKDVQNSYMQGMTTTDKYVVFNQVSTDDKNTNINIVDKNKFEVLNNVDEYCFGHANNLTYNPINKKYYISYCDSSNNYYIKSFEITENYKIEIKDITKTQRQYFAFTYDIDHNNFIGISGNTVYILDMDFNEIRHFKLRKILFN